MNNFLRDYYRILGLAGVPKDEFHSLRKTCITNWLEDGVAPHIVQHMAGHASVETTIRYYSKVDRTAIRRVRQASERYAPSVRV